MLNMTSWLRRHAWSARATARWVLPTPDRPVEAQPFAGVDELPRRPGRAPGRWVGFGLKEKSKPSKVAGLDRWAARRRRWTTLASQRASSSSHRVWRNSTCPSVPALASARRASRVSSIPVSLSRRSMGASWVWAAMVRALWSFKGAPPAQPRRGVNAARAALQQCRFGAGGQDLLHGIVGGVAGLDRALAGGLQSLVSVPLAEAHHALGLAENDMCDGRWWSVHQTARVWASLGRPGLGVPFR